MEFFLLIDDIRVFDVEHTSRTVKDAQWALQNHPVTHLLLDNDLGDDQPMEGIDILKWAIHNNVVPPNIFIVSANPIARKRMEDVLHYDLGYNLTPKGWWRK